MEAVPRLPMISFDLKVSPEPTSFASKLKQYIAEVYNEDADSYSNEIRQLEALRASAVRPIIDVTGCQTLKRYFCQLQFLQSRFPMGKGEPAAVNFSWRDIYASMVCSLADIKFEMVSILYNIGALHTQLGAAESRTTSDGMKMACTHFQCAAWAFQHLRQNYPQPAGVDLAPELMQYMQQLCLAQAQECILEKSMLDNRKATIIAKVAVQVVDYYNQALNTLQAGGDEGSIAETVGNKIYKEWSKYLKFKIAYHSCISLLYQGQQAEEQQKMGERVAFYHAASQELENARKLSKGLDNHAIINDALTFTMDVVEGKKKAATNENEFIYHEEVPDRDTLQLVKGASLVKGIPFNFNDVEVSGPDIFARLVPMQAHEASSIYSEEKAQLLRKITAQVEEKDAQLASYVSSLQLDSIEQAAQVVVNGVKMTDLPQDVVDRAALLSAKPDAIKKLVDVMANLANLYHEVESMLDEINHYFQEEETREKEYQTAVGSRPPSMVATELKREAGKYTEAHAKANESNQTLHRAMTLHVSNLKLLALPLDELRQHIPTIKSTDPNIDVEALKELSHLLNKIDEMRKQRATLVNQLRDAVNKDDITEQIVTKPADQPLEALFEQELQKHQQNVKLIEQNLAAQENIMQAMTDAYARHSGTRKVIIDLLKQRETTIHALTSSYDAYEDLLAKANKGIDFYRKLEGNVSKLLQRVKSTCKVQDEERETILAKNKPVTPTPITSETESTGPKLKDYLASMKRGETIRPPTSTYYNSNYIAPSIPSQAVVGYDQQLPSVPVAGSVDVPPVVIPSVRPAPVGSEGTNEIYKTDDKTSIPNYPTYNPSQANVLPNQYPVVSVPNNQVYSNYNSNTYNMYNQTNYNAPSSTVSTTVSDQSTTKTLEERMAALMAKSSKTYSTPTTTPIYNYGNNYQYPNPQAYIAPGTYYGQTNTSIPYTQNYQQPYYGEMSTYTSSVAQTHTTNMTPHAYSSASVQLPTQQPQMSQNIPSASTYYQPTQQNVTYPATHPPYATQSTPTAYQQPAPQVYTTASSVQYSTVASYHQQYTTPQYSTSASSQSVTPVPSNQPYSAATTISANQPYNAITTLPSNQPYSAATTVPSNQTYSVATTIPSNQPYSAAPTIPQNQTYSTPTTIPPNQSYSATPTVPSFTISNTVIPPQQYPHQINTQYSTNTTSSTTSLQYPSANYTYSTPTVNQQYPISTTPSSVSTTVSQQYPTNYPVASTYSQYGYPQYNATTPASQSSSTSVSEPYKQTQNPTYYPQGYYYQTSDTNNPTSPSSYYGHPGYSFDSTTGQYQYTSGFQNSATAINQAYISQVGPQNIPPVTDASHYTNAGTYNTTQTQSGQYTQQPPVTTNTTTGNYYSLPYGRQGQDVYTATTSASPHQSGQAQTPLTYTNSNNSNLSTTSANTNSTVIPSVQEKIVKKTESNIDLLADIDFNIPYAPLTPQVKTDSQQYIVIEKEKSTENKQPEATKFPTSDVELKPNLVKPQENMKSLKKDPLENVEVLQQFTQEVEKFEKFVENLTNKTLNGPTPLDLKWKELQDIQDRESQHLNISVARCYPIKNRFPDILPYDHSRVELPSTKDDYINASYVKNLSPTGPCFIMTQAPLHTTLSDFWTMVWEQQCEIIVCLLNDFELQEIYFPKEKNQDLVFGRFKLSLESFNVKPHWIERIITMCMLEPKTSRVIIHLQFTSWPGKSFPASPGPFLSFICEVLSFHNHQRSRDHPLVVHCEAGIGRSGLFCLLATYITQPTVLPDIVKLAAKISQYRKQSLRDREHLKFAYQAVLYHAQDLLMKRGILTSRSSFEESIKPKSHTRHPSQDLLLGPTSSSNIERSQSQQSNEEYPSTLGRRGSNISQTSLTSDRNSPIDTKFRRNRTPEEEPKHLLNTSHSADPLSSLDPLWSLKKSTD